MTAAAATTHLKYRMPVFRNPSNNSMLLCFMAVFLFRPERSLRGRKDIEGHFRASYPACEDASLEDFSLRGIRFRTAEEAKAYIADCLKQGAQYISVQTADDVAYQALITDLFENDEISRMLWDGNTRWTECQYFMNRVFRTLSVEFR